MPAAARKKPAALEATAAAPAPMIPDARLPLFDAIEARKKADAAVEQHLAAIAKARRLLWEGDPEDKAVRTKKDPADDYRDPLDREWDMDEPADDRIAELRRRIETAIEGDVKRAVTSLKSDGRIIQAFSGDSARRQLEAAQEKQRLTRAVIERLEQELPQLQTQAALAANEVIICRSELIRPLAEATLKRMADLRCAMAVQRATMAALLVDTIVQFPRDADFMATFEARKARDAAFRDTKHQFSHFALDGSSGPEQQQAVAAVSAEWNAALRALLTDAAAELPTLPKE